MSKHLRRLSNGQAQTLVQLPDTAGGITYASSVKTVFFSDPVVGQIGKVTPEGEVGFLTPPNSHPNIVGIDTFNDVLYCEDTKNFFCNLRFHSPFPFPMIGKRGMAMIKATQAKGDVPIDRVNGLCFSQMHGGVLLAFPQRHYIYFLGHDSLVSAIIGNGKRGFSIATRCGGMLNSPTGVACTQRQMIISDTGNHILREYLPKNWLSNGRLVGHPQETGHRDGERHLARLQNPSDICINYSNVYFVDNQTYIRSADLANFKVVTRYQSPHRIHSIASGEPDEIFFIEESQ